MLNCLYSQSTDGNVAAEPKSVLRPDPLLLANLHIRQRTYQVDTEAYSEISLDMGILSKTLRGGYNEFGIFPPLKDKNVQI